MTRHEQVIAEVFALYERFGDSDYIGEPVSQIEHMSQAAERAMAEGFDDEVVLAAFFHDIGHICAEHAPNMGGFGVVSHERLGADYLRRAGFSERLARLVEYHVQAKRYLTLREPGYFERLSEASRRTLEYQGGVMSEAEAIANFGQLAGPLIDTGEFLVPTGMDVDLREAMKNCVRAAIGILQARFGMDAEHAYAYLSAATDFNISQVVDIVTGVHAKIRVSDFA